MSIILKDEFDSFLKSYDELQLNDIWKRQSQKFSTFWNEIIMPAERGLEDTEIDEIVKLIDKHGKGNTPSDHSIARVMVPQGAWRRMFNHFVENAKLREALNTAMYSESTESRIRAINDLYKLNAGNKNNLTGATASAINAFLAISNPFDNLSVVSLNDRVKIMSYLNIEILDYNDMSIGQKVVASNDNLIQFFDSNDMSSNARTISEFFYKSRIREYWRNNEDELNDYNRQNEENKENSTPVFTDEEFSFYMESHLEDFLIENWDKTELGKKYDLVEEDGELVSQQYPTGIGIIDILAKEKSGNSYVVIELKKGQTSDKTVGQISRYMGWIDEHKDSKSDTKGVIITGKYDKKLYYALKKIRDVDIFIYSVDFQLNEYTDT